MSEEGVTGFRPLPATCYTRIIGDRYRCNFCHLCSCKRCTMCRDAMSEYTRHFKSAIFNEECEATHTLLLDCYVMNMIQVRNAERYVCVNCRRHCGDFLRFVCE